MTNLYQIFKSKVEKYTQRTALMVKEGTRYINISWEAYGNKVELTARALLGLGVETQEPVALLSENRPEWAYSDLGIISIGAVTVPIYPTSTSDEIEYILNDCRAKVIILSDTEQLRKILKIRHKVSALLHIIVIDGPIRFDDTAIVNFYRMIDRYKGTLELHDVFESRSRQVSEEDLASIIYTSGTTGEPKGVMLTHKNFLSNCRACRELLPLGESDLYLSFLPLSHVFERMAGHFFAIYAGITVAYAENIYTVSENMRQVHPTFTCAVPRFFEKTYAKILESVARNQLLRYIIKTRLGPMLISKRLKNAMGGRIKFFISGGAPLSEEIASFFHKARLMVLEGYGLTEAAPVLTANTLDDYKIGTVGRPLPNVEIKIAGDGEVLAKGSNVMEGYYKKPSETTTAIKDGWLYTGDTGRIDEDGFLTITGRKKDIIITAGGKNIAPAKVENAIRSDRFITEVMVYGDERKYLVALIVPNFELLRKYAVYKELDYASLDNLLKTPKVIDFFQRRINRCQKRLASFEQIKYFKLLDRDFTQEAGELTPTLKVKRNIVSRAYSNLIEDMYKD